MNHQWPQYKEKCVHCGRNRVFIKNFPLSCQCQWMKIIDREKKIATFQQISDIMCETKYEEKDAVPSD